MMNTKRIILQMAIIAMLLLTVASVNAQDPMKDAAADIVKQFLADQDVINLKGQMLVIAEFENINLKGDVVPRIFQEKLITACIKAKHFKVVERSQLQKAMQEMKIDANGLTDPETRKKLGKLLGAGYIMLGSISEAREAVSFDVRLVTIENGENIMAADYTTQQTPPPPATTTPGTPTKNPAIDTTQNTNVPNDMKGTYTGQKANGGLLGGSGFKVAWREKLDSPNILSISCGPIVNGEHRLVGLDAKKEDTLQSVMWRWDKDKFKRGTVIAENKEDKISSYFFNRIRVVQTADNTSMVIQTTKKEYDRTLTQCFLWDTNFREVSIPIIDKDTNHVSIITDSVHGKNNFITTVAVSENYSYKRFLTKFSLISNKDNKYDFSEQSKIDDKNYETVSSIPTGADFFGDGKIELAIPVIDKKSGLGQVKLYDKDNILKSATADEYGALVTAWIPKKTTLPFLAALKNDFKDDTTEQPARVGEGKKEVAKIPNGGYVYLLQWDGESMSELWKSPKLDNYILDLQEGDPKNEGEIGLLVLSGNSTECYLTKIVIEK